MREGLQLVLSCGGLHDPHAFFPFATVTGQVVVAAPRSPSGVSPLLSHAGGAHRNVCGNCSRTSGACPVKSVLNGAGCESEKDIYFMVGSARLRMEQNKTHECKSLNHWRYWRRKVWVSTTTSIKLPSGVWFVALNPKRLVIFTCRLSLLPSLELLFWAALQGSHFRPGVKIKLKESRWSTRAMFTWNSYLITIKCKTSNLASDVA